MRDAGQYRSPIMAINSREIIKEVRHVRTRETRFKR